MMPIHKVKGGWQWGNHGKVYKDRAGAEKQVAAAHANGYRGDAVDKLLSPFVGDALLNGGFDFPMSGDGTADQDIVPEDIFLEDGLDGLMGD
jgi:hypothetical protein